MQEPKDSKNQKGNYEQDVTDKKNGKIDERRNCKHYRPPFPPWNDGSGWGALGSVWIGEFKRSVDKDGKKCKGRVVCQRGEHGPFHCARIQAEESLPNAHAARI